MNFLFDKITFCVLVMSLLLLKSCKETEKKNVSDQISKKPNIIYILADDLGYGDLGFLGQKKFKTPNIDKLASMGMFFTQHYSGSTVCAPSRSALLTGQHTGHTAVRGNREILPEGQHPLPDSVATVTELLKDAGYRTGVFGKWGLGFPASEGDPNHQGVDEFFGYNCQRLAHHYYPYHLWHNQEKVVLEGNEGQGKAIYAPDLIHEEAIKFMEKNKDTTFFMLYASPLPHAELLVPDEEMEPFRGAFLPEKIYRGVDDGEKFRTGPYGSQDNSHATFAAMVAILDKQVGELIKKLEHLGIMDNTLVIFTSDNGAHKEGGADPDYFDSNGPFRGYKRDLYEGGIRTPMIAAWPGTIKPGTTTDHISAFWDVLPTISELTETQVNTHVDGISFLPTLLQQEGQKKHEYLYWEFHEMGGRIAVRKGKWKAVKYNVFKTPTGTLELYDLSVDEAETNNLTSQYPEKVKEMEQIMESAHTESSVFPFVSRL
ncbi:arylsulfatase [uncultured Wocania sp.]|uniref:arylsulfatase n=1 Tax=uncultured Wocania sp. TaxID=2834404 RepID=UPI0030F64D66